MPVGMGGASAPPPEAAAPAAAKGKKGKKGAKADGEGGGKKKLLIIAVGLIAVLGGVFWFVIKPMLMPADAEAVPEPTPGIVVDMQAKSINLLDGHYLRIAPSLQFNTEQTEEPSLAAAYDAVITVYSMQAVEDVNDPDKRDELKQQLFTILSEAYEGKLMAIYFNEYVTQ